MAEDGAASAFTDQEISGLQRFLDSTIADQRAGAAVAMIAEGGTIRWIGAAGELREGVPMPQDAIVPLASVGKMFTATAAMILYERGTIGLDDPVSDYIPEFAELKIESEGEDGAMVLVPPARPVTIRDLLTHTGGLRVSGNTYWGVYFRNVYQTTTTHLARALATLPMESQPGERYNYGETGGHYEVLAAVIEIASGETLEAFLTANVFAPLGMADSYFYLPEDKLDRRPAIYPVVEGTIDRARPTTRPFPRSSYFFGGGGVEASAADLNRFTGMLHGGGAFDGTRILKPETVKLMMQDHLGPRSTMGGGWSWGFGAAVLYSDASRATGVPDTYGWEGGGFSTLWVEPHRGLAGFVAFPLAAPGNRALLGEFAGLVAAALEEDGAE